MILQGDDLRYKIKLGVDSIADVVKVTLGPKGRNVIINGGDVPYLTKDGISVAKNVISSDAIKNSAISIVREASEKTASLAGDGTTTSLVLAQSMLQEGYKLLEFGKTIPEIRQYFNSGMEEFHSLLKEYIKPTKFDKSTLTFIAKTSANNDEEIGELVAEAYIKSGINGTVKAEQEQSSNTYIELKEGAHFKLGVISKDFYNPDKAVEAAYENALVLLFNNSVKTINDVKYAVQAAATAHRPLIIFADSFTPLAVSQLFANHYRGICEIIPIPVVGYSGHKRDLFGDLQSLVEGKVYESLPATGLNLGKCDKVSSNLIETVIMVNSPSAEYEAKIKQLEDLIDSEHVDSLKELYRHRLTDLKGNIATIFVGGTTSVEAKERYDRVDDAICAVKAALEEGVVDGGGATLLRISRKTLNPIFSKTLSAPFHQLESNSGISKIERFVTEETGYDFLNDEQCVLFDRGIIDSAKVVRLSVENAASVSLALLTTEGFVDLNTYGL